MLVWHYVYVQTLQSEPVIAADAGGHDWPARGSCSLVCNGLSALLSTKRMRLEFLSVTYLLLHRAKRAQLDPEKQGKFTLSETE
jgi:hypothetical protein